MGESLVSRGGGGQYAKEIIGVLAEERVCEGWQRIVRLGAGNMGGLGDERAGGE